MRENNRGRGLGQGDPVCGEHSYAEALKERTSHKEETKAKSLKQVRGWLNYGALQRPMV